MSPGEGLQSRVIGKLASGCGKLRSKVAATSTGGEVSLSLFTARMKVTTRHRTWHQGSLRGPTPGNDRVSSRHLQINPDPRLGGRGARKAEGGLRFEAPRGPALEGEGPEG